jgi:hypothetical protein
VKKDASTFVVTQDSFSILRIGTRVLLDDLFPGQIQMLGQRVNVVERNVYSRFPATIRTSRAIDLFFHGSGNLMKQVIPVVVMLEKSPKAKIFATLVFSDLADLDKIRDHVSSILLL